MTAALAIAQLTWLRLRRGRTIWITLLLFCIPIAVAAVASFRVEDPFTRWTHLTDLTLRSLVLLAPVIHLAPALAEELDQHTHTFLFSRPIPRAAVLHGKMLVVTPALVALSTLAILAAWAIATTGPGVTQAAWLPPALLAVTTGVIATSAFAIGLGTLLPRAPLAVAIGWVLLFEQVFPAIPTLQHLSTLFHTQVIADVPHSFILKADTSAPRSLVSLGVLSAIWLSLATWKIRR